jgi:hypothetical protein
MEDSPKSATRGVFVADGISGSHTTQSSSDLSLEAAFRMRPESTTCGGDSTSTPGAVVGGLVAETLVLSSIWSIKQNRTRLKIKYRTIGAAPKALMRAIIARRVRLHSLMIALHFVVALTLLFVEIETRFGTVTLLT